jgi:iron complex outermembrane receptor protein
MFRCLSSRQVLWRAALLALTTLVLSGVVQAQAGRIAGTVTNDAGDPLPSAQVVVVGSGLYGVTNEDGRYVIASVPPGTHAVRVMHLGHRYKLVENVTVPAGGEARVDAVLTPIPASLGGVVISATRQAERVTDAPATVTQIGADAIANSVGNSFSGALKEVKGLDYVQVGVTSAAINARGFNSSFNNRMLMMEDGRIAVLPENGLPVGQFTAIPKVDLANIEVLVGPGAALYGADASNGVITLTTKDPQEYPGTTVEIAGGSREYKDFQARHAGVAGQIGYKVAAEYQSAHDFENYLKYASGTTLLDEIGIDWDSDVTRGTGALVYYAGDQRFELNAGMSKSNGVGQTNVGRNQLVDWGYDHQQLKWSSPGWYANVYRTHSTAGESYAINRFTTNTFANPDSSAAAVRLMSDWPSDGQLYAAELQNNFIVGALQGTRVVWGGQYRYDIVSSDREWLTDRQTGEDLTISQFGVYAQTETPIGARLSLLLAGRYDNHENYDAQFSPKAGIVFKPAEEQALRLTYNRAFKSPSTLQTNFFIPNFVPAIGVFGNRDGFTVKDSAGTTTLLTITPLVPEENVTWELGYKGVLGSRFYIDATGYYSDYKNFLGSLKAINNPYAAGARTFAYDHTGQVITDENDVPQIVLTYRNLGDATIYGTDVGTRFLLTPTVTLSGTMSWITLNSVEETATDREATALNSTPVKWAVGAEFDRIAGPLFGGFTARHVTGYTFQSGINVGRIPTFNTVDAHLGYRLPPIGDSGSATINLSVTNLFGCRSKVEGTESSNSCSFGEKHIEMVNMPEIGTIVFLGVRYHR